MSGESQLTHYAARVAVVTGAGSGIGRALALGLARCGAQVALADRSAEALAGTARQCERAGGQVRADTVDVTSRAAVLDYATAVRNDFREVSLVFCGAGVIHTGSLLASEFADIDPVISINLLGTVNTAKAFLPALIASGDGQLVTFSSGFGLVAAPHYSAYSASKFAVRGFSESLRQEMAADGHPVSVTCVYPGRIRTPILRSGSFAADEDANAVAARFEKMARMGPAKAAAIILRGVAHRKAQLLVGADAHAVSLLARAAGGSYTDWLP
ncbi:MAG: SDR family oxidoreductase, partial [Nocardiopsaceae bacterium]|nr:SDR family oxidoreductase [Nocardiopsaceae bacterium]